MELQATPSLHRSQSADNIGHVLFENYIPILGSIDSWLGLEAAKNVVIVDERDSSELWSPKFQHVYEKVRVEV